MMVQELYLELTKKPEDEVKQDPVPLTKEILTSVLNVIHYADP